MHVACGLPPAVGCTSPSCAHTLLPTFDFPVMVRRIPCYARANFLLFLSFSRRNFGQPPEYTPVSEICGTPKGGRYFFEQGISGWQGNRQTVVSPKTQETGAAKGGFRVPDGVVLPLRYDGLPPQSPRGCARFARVLKTRAVFQRLNGGAGGIRTLDTLLAYTHFPGERLRPLGHRSACTGSRAP